MSYLALIFQYPIESKETKTGLVIRSQGTLATRQVPDRFLAKPNLLDQLKDLKPSQRVGLMSLSLANGSAQNNLSRPDPVVTLSISTSNTPFTINIFFIININISAPLISVYNYKKAELLTNRPLFVLLDSSNN